MIQPSRRLIAHRTVCDSGTGALDDPYVIEDSYNYVLTGSNNSNRLKYYGWDENGSGCNYNHDTCSTVYSRFNDATLNATYNVSLASANNLGAKYDYFSSSDAIYACICGDDGKPICLGTDEDRSVNSNYGYCDSNSSTQHVACRDNINAVWCYVYGEVGYAYCS